MAKQKDKRLSPSSIGEWKDNPRAFWIAYHHGIERPRGIFSSVPNAIDSLMKEDFDQHREAGTMPAEFKRLADDGIRFYRDPAMLKACRHWSTAPTWLDPETGWTLSGAVDDLLIDPENKVMILDVKTRKNGDALLDYTLQYYAGKLAMYDWILSRGGLAKINMGKGAGGKAVYDLRIAAPFGTTGKAIVPYYFPKMSRPTEDGSRTITWGCEIVELALDHASAIADFRAAVACLEGPLPPAGLKEEWDSYALRYVEVVVADKLAREEAAKQAGLAPAPAEG